MLTEKQLTMAHVDVDTIKTILDLYGVENENSNLVEFFWESQLEDVILKFGVRNPDLKAIRAEMAEYEWEHEEIDDQDLERDYYHYLQEKVEDLELSDLV